MFCLHLVKLNTCIPHKRVIPSPGIDPRKNRCVHKPQFINKSAHCNAVKVLVVVVITKNLESML